MMEAEAKLPSRGSDPCFMSSRTDRPSGREGVLERVGKVGGEALRCYGKGNLWSRSEKSTSFG